MRREPLLGIGFVLGAIGEVVRASSLYAAADSVQAIFAFAAGASLLLVAGGYFFSADVPWATPLGLAAAALAYVLGLALRIPGVQADLVTLAAVAFALGLALAAWASREAKLDLMPFRIGLGLVALGAILSAAAHMQAGETVLLLGNAFSLVGFTMAAAVAALPHTALPSAGTARE